MKEYFLHFVLAALLTSSAYVAYKLRKRYLQRLGRVLLSWRKPEVTVYSLIVFVLNVVVVSSSLFILGAWYEGVLNQLLDIPAETLRLLAVNLLVFILEVNIAYFVLDTNLKIYVTERGIVFSQLQWSIKEPIRIRLLLWEQIVDYYRREDYPAMLYTLIIRDLDKRNKRYGKIRLWVPFFALRSFEALLNKMFHVHQRWEVEQFFTDEGFGHN